MLKTLWWLAKMAEKNIEFIIFDVDGTLYYFNDNFKSMVKRMQFTKAKRLDPDLKEEDYFEIYEKLNSHSQTFKKLGLDYKESLKVYHSLEYSKILEKDPELADLLHFIRFEKNIPQALLTTAPSVCVDRVLDVLGVDPRLFEIIITSDTEGVKPKPDTSGLKKIIYFSGVQPGKILTVGDREEVDIIPAKELGLQTALVWNIKEQETSADYSFKNVYSIRDLIK